MNTHKHVNTNI